MKNISFKAFILFMILVFVLSGCAHDNITITGSATYYSSTNSNETSSVNTSNSGKIWNVLTDGLEPITFTIVNNTDTNFVNVEYKAAGFDNYEILDYTLAPEGSCQIQFSKLTVSTYKSFEFRLKTSFDTYVNLNPVNIAEDKGIEIVKISGEYNYNYLKNASAD